MFVVVSNRTHWCELNLAQHAGILMKRPPFHNAAWKEHQETGQGLL